MLNKFSWGGDIQNSIIHMKGKNSKKTISCYEHTTNKEIIKFKKDFIIEKKHGNTLPCIRCVVVLKEKTYNKIIRQKGYKFRRF